MKLSRAILLGLIQTSTVVLASAPTTTTKNETKQHNGKSNDHTFVHDIIRVAGGLICCAAGIYALLQAKQSYDKDQGILGKANKIKTKVSSFVDKFVGEKDDPVDSFYTENKNKVHASGWATGGLGLLVIGLKVLVGSSSKAK